MAGEKIWSTSKSTQDAIKRFNNAKLESGKIEVVHFTGENSFIRKGETLTPSKAAAGKKGETAGLYVAPMGEGSLYFTRIRTAGMETQYSLLPNIKPQIPTGIKIEVGGVSTVPRSIQRLDDQYLTASNKFLLEKGKPSTAYITPRFQQGYTSELEAVIPPNTRLATRDYGGFLQNLKGFNKR